MTSLPAVTPARLSALVRCAAVFLPSDPPRAGRVAFWRPDGEPLADPTAGDGPTVDALPVADGIPVVLPDADGGVSVCAVPAVVLPVAAAVPVLTRARTARGADPAAAFWGAAAMLALQLAARGRLLPGLSAADHDAWRLGPLDPADVERLRDLAAAMPPSAHATPLPDTDPVLLPEPERHLRAFLDAVADGLPRSPAAALATGAPAFAASAPQRIPEQRAWAADVAAGQDAGVRISLRVEMHGAVGPVEPDVPPGGDSTSKQHGQAAEETRTGRGSESREEQPPREGPPYDGPADPDAARIGFTAVLQLHSLTDPTLVADAAEVWAGTSAAGQAFGPRARMDTLRTLRRAADAWAPLTPLLSAAVPGALDLADEEIAELLGQAARALAAAGVRVHWPRGWRARSPPGPWWERPTRWADRSPHCPRCSPPMRCSPSAGGSRWVTRSSTRRSWTGSPRPVVRWCGCATGGC